MTTYYKNPGLVEIQSLTTFGVNVKENENAIGHFGTGFKYGTGIVMRLGGKVTVYRGLEKYEFFTREETIRGKSFKMVHMLKPDGTDVPVGMTSEVGKNWQPWMAYREFRCNAQDEKGFTTMSPQKPEEGHTTIVVECEDLDLAHQKQHIYFVTTDPTFQLEELDLHPYVEGDDGIFYKGVRVGEFREVCMFRYNFTSGIMLSEDRTISSAYYVEAAIRRSYAQCTDTQLLYKVFTAHTDTMEARIDFSSLASASQQFLDTAELVLKQKPLYYNITLRKLLSRLRNFDPYEWLDPTVLEAKMLMKAEAIVRSLGLDTSKKYIRVVDNLGADVLGECHGHNIYLSKKVFGMGTKMVAGTLFEEMVHSNYGHKDCTREMQNYLIDKCMSLVEELNGDPM